MTRLPYETRGGSFSRDTSITQGVEHLRLAAEAFYAVGHFDKHQDDNALGDKWLKIGENLEQMAKLALALAIHRRN